MTRRYYEHKEKLICDFQEMTAQERGLLLDRLTKALVHLKEAKRHRNN